MTEKLHCEIEEICRLYHNRTYEYRKDLSCGMTCVHDSRSRPYDIDAVRKVEREKTITLLEEIETGISSYEKENEHKQVHDECKGIYIPINVVRRLITVRKESLLKLLSCDSQDGG